MIRRSMLRGTAAVLPWCLTATASLACEAIAPVGAPPPRVTGEAAAIIWDRKQGVEHFIRRAAFATKSDRLAFLVPTPTVPKLAEVNPDFFYKLEEVMKPKIVERVVHRPLLYSWIFGGQVKSDSPAPAAAAGVAGDPASVEVLGRQSVSGYDATILKARDEKALRDFLQRNGYPTSPTTIQWLRPYVAKGWIITAFKVSGDQENDIAPELAPVRMTFATPRPFYPYHEPPAAKDAGKHPRSLRIFLLTDEGRMAAILGENGVAWGTENFQQLLKKKNPQNDIYHAREENLGAELPGHIGVEWAGKADFTGADDYLRPVDSAGKATGERIALPGYMTVFTDTSSPRMGTDDLYFAPATDQTEIKPEPIEHTTYVFDEKPIEPFLLIPAGFIGGIIWLRKRAKSR